MVNELIVAFLGTLPLDQHPESKPFTPFDTRVLGRPHRVTPEGLGFIPVPAIGFSVPIGRAPRVAAGMGCAGLLT